MMWLPSEGMGLILFCTYWYVFHYIDIILIEVVLVFQSISLSLLFFFSSPLGRERGQEKTSVIHLEAASALTTDRLSPCKSDNCVSMEEA